MQRPIIFFIVWLQNVEIIVKVIQWQTLRKVVVYANESQKSSCLDRWIFSWKKFGRGKQTDDKSTCNISVFIFQTGWHKSSARDIFKVILTELEFVWNKAAIPMKDRKHQLDQCFREVRIMALFLFSIVSLLSLSLIISLPFPIFPTAHA